RLLQLRDPRLDEIRYRRRAVFAGLDDVEADRLATVEQRRRRRLGRTRLGACHLTQRDQGAAALRDNELIELFRMFETSLETDRALLERSGHLTDGRREILRSDGIHDLFDADTERGELRRANIDVELRAVAADDIHLCHTGDRAQFARNPRIRELREL